MAAKGKAAATLTTSADGAVETRRESHARIRRKLIFHAVVRLNSGFITSEAGRAILDLSRKLTRRTITVGGQPPEPLTAHEQGLLDEVRAVGFWPGWLPHNALSYLKEMEEEGLLTKVLVDKETRTEIEAGFNKGGRGTYSWYWVEE